MLRVSNLRKRQKKKKKKKKKIVALNTTEVDFNHINKT